MIIHVATDHAGLELKNSIRDYLINKGHDVTDHGAHEYDALDDYPCLLYTSPSPRDRTRSRMPSSA